MPDTTRLVVLTGAPHSGKTTLIDCLAARGYPVLRESAIEIIAELDRLLPDQREWRARNAENHSTFQAMVGHRQQQREAALLARKVGPLAFTDRSLIDSVAYCAYRQHEPPRSLCGAVLRSRYAVAFLLDMILPFDERLGTGRHDTEACARDIDRHLERQYTEHGVGAIRLPVMPVDARADALLSSLGVTSSRA